MLTVRAGAMTAVALKLAVWLELILLNVRLGGVNV